MRIILTLFLGLSLLQLKGQIDSLYNVKKDSLFSLSDTLLLPIDSLTLTDSVEQKNQKKAIAIDPNLQLWQGLDKYGIEKNSWILSPKGWYKFYEQDLVLLEDSLDISIELGTYQWIESSIHFTPLTGRTAYHPYSYELTSKSDSSFQILDYEKGNSGNYSLYPSPAFSAAELDFFQGIVLHEELLKTTWLDEETQESWQFIAPDYALIKTQGAQEFTAQALFSEDLITFVNPHNGQIIFRAEITYRSDEVLQIKDLRKGRQLFFKKQPYAGLTARETHFYRQYVKALYDLEIEALPTKF